MGNNEYNQKVITYKRKKKFTSKVVDQVCFGMIDDDIFQLLDLVLTNPKSAVNFIQ